MQSILEEAQTLIRGDREQDYGHPKINLEKVAQQWSLSLSHQVQSGAMWL